MKRVSPLAVALTLLVSACENESQRSAVYAEKCKEAERKGFLEAAEELCENAWMDVDNNRLGPEIQSQRLYDLGRIKRQSSKYAEAEPLLRQALAIEEAVSGPVSIASGLRRFELSLVMAGQDRWAEGAEILAGILETVDRFPQREKMESANTFKHYASRLRNTDQAELASLFELKATELSAIKQTDAGQAD